jgi:hypothetical protein
MQSETMGAVLARVQALESDVAAVRRMVDGEALAVSDRQYLERCFDLLDMEVRALLQYLGALHEPS